MKDDGGFLYPEWYRQLLVAQKVVRHSVVGRGAVLSDGLAVLSCGVALVVLPVVLRVFLGQTVHIVVAVRLGQDTGCRDGEVFAVALDDTGMRDGGCGMVRPFSPRVGNESVTIDDECLRAYAELVDSPVHGQETGS